MKEKNLKSFAELDPKETDVYFVLGEGLKMELRRG